MRLVTLCPHCSAGFYVSPEQLAVHGGDVRCGKCEHVFNALDRLAEIEDAEPEEASAVTASPEAGHIQQDSWLPEQTTQEPALLNDIEIIAEHDAPLEAEASALKEDELKDSDIESTVLPVFQTDKPAFRIVDFSVPSSSDMMSPTMMEDAAKNKTGQPKKSALAKSLVFFGICALLSLAFAQTAYYLRSEIAARWPDARSYLVQACALIQCKVALPKNADLIVIDDSDLQEDAERQGLIHLYSTLVNQADYSQTYPLLELTLTDLNDKPLLRRTFKPEEYMAAGADIRRGMSAKEEVSIKLSLTASGEAVAGYRLFVTY